MRQQSFLASLLSSPRVVLTGVGVLAGVFAIGTFFYVQSRQVMEAQLRERLRTTAAVAALQFDPAVIDSIHSPKDMQTPQFTVLVHQLNAIRDSVPGIRFVYLMRKTADPMTLTFVADADSLASDAQLDVNHNGVVDKAEKASYPGDPYGIMGAPALQHDAFVMPSVDSELTNDQWGSTISGYAPIRDAQGHAIAVLGIDMSANEYLAQAQSIFSPVAFLLLLAAGLLLAVFVIERVAQRRIEAMRELDTERTALMQLTTHQLGAPLATFKWWMELQQGKEGTDLSPDDMQMLRDGVSRMDTIMQSLQEAYRVFSGEIPFHVEDVSLRDIIQKVVAATKEIRDARHQTLVLNIETTDEKMHLDSKLTTAVLHELLDNATTYSKEGTTITLRALRRRNEIEVQVQDEGVGIPAQDLRHIFERFTRGANSFRLKPVGNGLGLYTAKGIIERAGGRMWIESEEGKGTTVSFTLPLG